MEARSDSTYLTNPRPRCRARVESRNKRLDCGHSITALPRARGSAVGGDASHVDLRGSPDLALADFDSGSGEFSDFSVDEGVFEFVEIDSFDTASAGEFRGGSVLDSIEVGRTIVGVGGSDAGGSYYLFQEAFS